ncbi:MAG: hypothetical protein AAB791_01545 [Patescibacteria group bacterium]
MPVKEKNRKATKKTPPTQRSLEVREIRDDCVVMKDGSLRAVLLVSSVNFALKSEDEQNAVISAYVSFLNTLEGPVQILIQSRQLDLDNYLLSLTKLEREQTNELLKLQTAEYRQYISELVELGDIMTKRFFVVVPYNPLTDQRRNFWSRTGDLFSPSGTITLNQKQFAKRHEDLFMRVDNVISGLSSMGLRSSMLNTQSLIELYYNTYNPTVSKNEPIVEVGKLKIEED